MVVRVAMANGQDLLGIITIDGLRYAELAKDPVLKVLKGPRSRPSPPRIYETYEEAVSRFQLRPAPLEPIANDFILDHIARHSVRSVEGGWTSKYDTAQSLTTTLALELKDALKDLKCQSAAIYAEHTHMSDAGVADMMTTLNDGRATVFVIPGTTHYLPIDSPFAFIAAVKGIALTWIASSGNAKQRPAAP
jgi:pimeloyl-ACP methyl ester carboxylesterase